MRLADLNALDHDAAEAAFRRCCGSSRWAQRMADARPFASAEAMAARADAIWRALDRPDWHEAFAAHPVIGGQGSVSSSTAAWSNAEQAGVATAVEQTRRGLAEANRDYHERFGYIFIVCATGKTGDDMLGLLARRLQHDPDVELRVAAEEQRKITQLRLRKLLEEEADRR